MTDMPAEPNSTPPAENPAPPTNPTGSTTEPPVEPKVEPAAPEPITWEAFKLPEGLAINEDFQKEFVEVVNKDLSPAERAQALLDLHAKVGASMQEAAVQEWNKIQDGWLEEVKADPVIGGDKLPGVLTNIGKLVDEFGSPELRTAFDLTGAGNNPAIIRFLNTVASKLVEGGPVGGQPPAQPQSLAEKLYPSMKS